MALKLWTAAVGAPFEVHARFTNPDGAGGFGVSAKHPDDNTPVTPVTSQTTISDATWSFPAFDKNTLVTITCVKMTPGDAVLAIDCKQNGQVLACRVSVIQDPINGPPGGPFTPERESVGLNAGSGVLGLILTDLV